MFRTMPLMVAGCGVIVAALVAGCGGAGTGGSAGPAATPSSVSPASTSTSTTTVSPTTKEPPAPTTTTAPPALSSQCTVADLTVSLRGEDGAMGIMYRGLVFTNTGRRTCTIQGFPGVSFVAGEDGHQVGQAAAWVGGKGPEVTLKPGASATAPLGFTNIDHFDPADCRPTPVRGLRVYPPHDTRAAFVPFPTRGCTRAVPSNHLKVRTVHAGSDLS
jgi:hypothetical protein